MRIWFLFEVTIVVLITVMLSCSCSMKQFYPTGGALLGAGVGSLAGPGGAALGGGGGALLGEVARGNAEIEEARETIDALTHGDVSELVEQGLGEHKSSFDEFVSKIQRILLIVGICLICYLAIPVFVARRCAKQEAEKTLTRAPFPVKPSHKP